MQNESDKCSFSKLLLGIGVEEVRHMSAKKLSGDTANTTQVFKNMPATSDSK